MIWLIGSNSHLATCVQKRLPPNLKIKELNRGSSEKETGFDLNSFENFDYSVFDSEATLIFFAGVSSPDTCENYPENSYKINVLGTAGFISHVLGRGSKVVFLSSDAVYGESQTPAEENGPLKPKGNYGSFKLAIEDRFRDYSKFKAIRLSYVYTGDDKFSLYLLGCYERGEVASVFSGYERSIVHIDDVVLGLQNLISNWDRVPFRTINFAGPRCISRIDFANDFMIAHNLQGLKLESNEPPKDFFSARAITTRSSTVLFEQIINKKPREIF